MVEIKTFKTKEKLEKFIEKNKDNYIIEEVFIDNEFGVEITPIKKIDIK